MKKYVIEFIGTFFLVTTVAFTGNPFAIAAILIAMIYMGGYISGGHFNPAVTTGVLVRGKISWLDAIIYMIVQLLAGVAAALLYMSITGQKFIPQPDIQATLATAIIMEALYTFALASVVLHVATSEETEGNNYYGAAIGLVVLAGAFAGGLSGGAYNPAVGVGPLLADIGNISARMQNILIYIIGPMSGGLLAGLIYRLLNLKPATGEKKEKK
jgi:aquaporin Z